MYPKCPDHSAKWASLTMRTTRQGLTAAASFAVAACRPLLQEDEQGTTKTTSTFPRPGA